MLRSSGKYLVLMSILLMGLSAVSILPTAEGAETGYFHVYVEGSDTQLPIDGAYVAIDDDIAWRTLKDGRCTPTGVEFGVHNITVYADGYRASTQRVEFTKNGTEYRFVLSPNEPVRESFIKGTVHLERYLPPYDAGEAVIGFMDPTGAPIPGLVDVYPTDDPLVGEYFVMVSPGSYHLWCSIEGHSTGYSEMISVKEGSVVYHDFYLKFMGFKSSGLAGNITDAVTGDPITGATVVATSGTTTLETLTDSYGFYFFSGLPPGTYTVIAAHTNYLPDSGSGTVNWGQITYVDMKLKRTKINQTILWGFVYGDGIPLSTATVFTDVPNVLGTNAMGVAGLYAIMDYPGDEDHLVGATASGYYPTSTNVTVPTGTIQRQDLYLQSGNVRKWGVLIASVYEEGTSVPVNDSTVHLDNPGVFTNSQNTGTSSNTVVWVGIPAWGSYTFNCMASGYTFVGYDKTPGAGPYLPSDTFTVSSSVINEAKLFMNRTEVQDEAKIWGYVINAGSSTPVSGCPILDITGNMSLFSTTDAVGFYVEYVVPDNYTLVALPPGAYSIMNYDHATGVWGWGPWTGTVSAGESRHVDYYIKIEKEGMLISGQVVMEGTGDPISGFDLEAISPSSAVLYDSTPSSGFFLFSPLWDAGTWTLDGSHSSLYVVDVEYWLLPSGPHQVSSTLPITFNLSVPDSMWVRITVSKEPQSDRTQIWGYVYVDSIGGYTSHFSSVLDLTGAMTVFDVTDSTGHYQNFVVPGTFTLMPLAVGGYSVLSYDHATGTLSTAPWTGAVSPGESRHVDFVMKQDRESAKIAGQVVMEGTNATVSGFSVSISSGSLSYTETTPSNGFFLFPPVYLFSTWDLTGSHPSLFVQEVKYHLWPGGTVSTSPSLPVSFSIGMSDIMWVEIIVSQEEPLVSMLYGNVFRFFSNIPIPGATVRIYQMPGMVLTDTLTTSGSGYYEKYLFPGDYYVKASLTGYTASSANVVMTPGSILYQPFYLMPRIVVKPIPLNISIIFVNAKNNTPLEGLKVSVAGVEDMVTDEDGFVEFRIPEAGEYSIHTSAASVVLYDADGNRVGSLDDPVKLESNETYTAKVTYYREIIVEDGSSREAEENVIPDAGWLGILLVALLVGGVIGFVLRRPKGSDIEE